MKKSDRAIAVSVLSEILDEGAYANIALRKALAESGLSSQSRAFVTELVNETVRNLLLIDCIIESFSSSPASEMKPFIRNVLRIAICQIRFLERIPERAAVDEAVKLTKAQGFGRLSGFVNAILRSITREPQKPEYSQKDMAMRFSYPPWLVNSLVKWLGSKGAIEFCENSHKPAPVTILTNTLKTDMISLTKLLEGEGVEVIQPQIDATVEDFPMLVLSRTGDITRLKAFREGHFIVADPGSMAAVHALSANPGQTIIDLCAAPGGKSFATAFHMRDKGRILACDIHPHKMELLKQTQKRLGLTVIEPILNDAQVFNPRMQHIADAVLLDAPCSGLGTIRKHPEIKYNRTPEDIQFLSKKQALMLSMAMNYVKSGGILVYCTCTVSSEENMDVINDFIAANSDFTLEYSQQTLPSLTSDGFFTAKLRRS